MKRSFVLALSTLLLCGLALADKPEKPVHTKHITFIAPGSFDELWNESDLVVHVRVLGGRAELKKSDRARHVFTSHRAKVLEVYKTQVTNDCAALADEVLRCSPRAGDELALLQDAGEVETADEIIRIAGEKPLQPGAEYVVFLDWNSHLKTFIASYGPHGTFEVSNGEIHPASEWRVSKEQKGKTAAKFADELRRKGGSR